MAKTNFLVKAKNLLSNLWKKWCNLSLSFRLFLVIAVILFLPFESFLDATGYTLIGNEEDFVKLENIAYNIADDKSLDVALSDDILESFEVINKLNGDILLKLDSTGETLYITMSDSFEIRKMEKSNIMGAGTVLLLTFGCIMLSLVLSWIIEGIFKRLKKLVQNIKKKSCKT